MGDADQTKSVEVRSLARAIGLDQAYAGGGVALTTVINDIIYWGDRLLEDSQDELVRSQLKLAIDRARKLATETPESVAFWFDRHAEREVQRAFADKYANANGGGGGRRARPKKQAEQRVSTSG